MFHKLQDNVSRVVQTVEIKEAVQIKLKKTRKLVHTHIIVWQSLRTQQLYPYNMKREETQFPKNFPIFTDDTSLHKTDKMLLRSGYMLRS